MPLPLSATIITFNERDNIERTLQALDFVQDVVVVDSGSTDGTLDILKKFQNVRVFHRDFDTYANQKNYALTLAKELWVLALDADEVLSPDLRDEILSLKDEFQKDSIFGHYGFQIPRLTRYLGTWIRHGGWYPNHQIRFFRLGKGKFTGDLVHEKVVLQGSLGTFKNPLYHFSYKNISDHIQFIDRYSDLFSEEEAKKGRKSSIGWAIGKGFFKMIWMYLFRFGFLDGKPGIVLALLGFYYNFLKYVKLYEKNQTQLVSPLFVVVDPVHRVESKISSHQDRN